MLAWNPPSRRPRRPGLPHRAVRSAAASRSGTAAGTAATTPLTYSVLFPPLAPLLGPQVVGGLAVVASTYLFDRLVRDHWGAAPAGRRSGSRPGSITLLADGQLTFALGVAFGLAALRALQTATAPAACALAAGRSADAPAPARSPAVLPALASCAAGCSLSGASAASRAALWRLRRSPSASSLIPNLAFPDRRASSVHLLLLLAIPLWCGSALYVYPRPAPARSGSCAGVLAATCSAATLIWLASRTRWAATRSGSAPSSAGPVLAAVLLARRPRVAGLVPRAVPGRRPLLAADRERHARSPAASATPPTATPTSTRRCWPSWLRAHGGEPVRIEVPPTARPLGVGLLAARFELARGWLRQLETDRATALLRDRRSHRRLLQQLAARRTGSATSPSPTPRSTTRPPPSDG